MGYLLTLTLTLGCAPTYTPALQTAVSEYEAPADSLPADPLGKEALPLGHDAPAPDAAPIASGVSESLAAGPCEVQGNRGADLQDGRLDLGEVVTKEYVDAQDQKVIDNINGALWELQQHYEERLRKLENPPVAVAEKPVANFPRLYVYTDPTWCGPCRVNEGVLNRWLGELQSAGLTVVHGLDDAKGHVRVFDRVPDFTGLPITGIPTAVAIDDAKSVTRACNALAVATDPELYAYLITGRCQWTTLRVRTVLNGYRLLAKRTDATVEGMTVREHLIGPDEVGHHGWPVAIVDSLSEAEKNLLHSADHDGVMQP